MIIEYFKEMTKELRKEWTEILNSLWRQGVLGKGWEKAIICLIFKASDKDDVKNYRGISLLNVGYKILATVVNRRLKEWLEKEGKLKESQAGFRAKRSTIDHIFTLNSIINDRLKQKGKKLHVAFIDFRAAFDNIDRELMIKKLEKIGIEERMLKVIREVYSKTINVVKTNDGLLFSLLRRGKNAFTQPSTFGR